MANEENDLGGLVNYEFEKQHTTPEVTGPPPPEAAKAGTQDLSTILDIILGVVTDG